jgi:hypothetical protein
MESMSETPEPEHEAPALLGQHVTARERDLVSIRLRGPLSLEEAQGFHAAVARTLARYGTAFVLVDSSQGGSLSPETRRWIAEWNKSHKVTGVAIFGSSLVVRALLTLVLNAIALMRREAVPSVFVKNEAQARAWLAALRSRLRGPAQKG